MLEVFRVKPKQIYLDYNSSTPIFKKVLEFMEPFYEGYFYNPSAKYALDLKEYLENAKAQTLGILGAKDGFIVHYGGGTEAISSFLQGLAFQILYTNSNKKHIIASTIEHDASIKTLEHLKLFGFEITYAPVDKNGVVDVDFIENAIKKETALISIMHVNNETGVLQPIKEISNIAKKHGVIFHSDGIAAVGKVKINIEDLGVDAYTITAHKFYGPKGSAINYIKNGVEIRPVILGSHQQYGLKAGTENVAGFIGLYKALELLLADQEKYVEEETKLLQTLENGLKNSIADFSINSPKNLRVCNTLNVGFAGCISANIIKKLSQKEVCVSLGAASVGDSFSHVIKAMNVEEKYAKGTIRFSIGRFTTKEEITKAIEITTDVIKELRG
jgi:cysteine desulfurase